MERMERRKERKRACARRQNQNQGNGCAWKQRLVMYDWQIHIWLGTELTERAYVCVCVLCCVYCSYERIRSSHAIEMLSSERGYMRFAHMG